MASSAKLIKDITVYGKYAKFLTNKKRRETFTEICDRNKEMHKKKFAAYPEVLKELDYIYNNFIKSKKILPSMRSMQFAGKPIEIAPNRLYNCAFAPTDHIKDFNETMFLLLGGSGKGYSIQKHHIEKLPTITIPTKSRRYLISDSIEGWADAVKVLMEAYFLGKSRPLFDYSDIRPEGAPLVTSGGKAPGPEPLKVALSAIEKILMNKKQGESLATIEANDIQCFIADAVYAGGIRRAAMIALFSLDDENMLNCKSNFQITSWKHLEADGPMNTVGEIVKTVQTHVDKRGKLFYDIEVTVDEPYYGVSDKVLSWVSEKDLDLLKKSGRLPWYYFQPQRGRSNNSAVILRHRVKKRDFMKLWKKIKESGCGEPGFVFTNNADWGVNPCVEIGLRPHQFCNLVEINASDIKDQQDFNERAYAASYISTLQASYTDFHYLRNIWKKTTEREALTAVSLTGVASGAIDGLDAQEAADIVVKTNVALAKLIGINPSARSTCIKPAGTTSIILSNEDNDELCPSGIHGAHAPYIIRRMRFGKEESIFKFLSKNIPNLIEDDFYSPQATGIICIPMKAPKNSIMRTEPAIALLERIKGLNQSWIMPGHISGDNTHNISATISIKDEEWEDVAEWMWVNKSFYNGLSVLPYDGGTYIQAPFEEITEEKYNEMMKHVKDLDFTKIKEDVDQTDLSGEIACAGGVCELTF